MPAQAPRYLQVPPDDLLFDVSNPRFGGLAKGDSQQPAILEHLKHDPHFATELIDSLVENGFIPYEPLVVKPFRNKWIVVEGNRRLAAVKTILADKAYPKSVRDRLAKIPVITFPAATAAESQNDLRIYLGIRHLFGYREWPSLSKARFLDVETTKLSVDKIASEIGISKQEIRRFVVPLRLLKARMISPEIEDDFWVLGEALSRTNIQRFIELDVDPRSLSINSFNKVRFDELLDFLYGKKAGPKQSRNGETKAIGETRDLKTLAAVVANKDALQALRKGKSLEIAADFIDTRPQKIKRLSTLTDRVATLVKQVTDGISSDAATDLKNSTIVFAKSSKRFVARHG